MSSAAIRREDLLHTLRSGQRFLIDDVEIRCDAIAAVAYRDLLDAYIGLSLRRGARWVDAAGRVEPVRPLPEALGRVLLDVTVWPALYLRYHRNVRRLLRGMAPAHWTAGNRGLFLRTDHWFHMKSGGSVGHLQGVIGGLRGLGVSTEVVSTDPLAGVPADEQFHLCGPRYGVGRNLPTIPELQYNDTLTEFISEHWTEWNPAFVYQRYSLNNYVGVLCKQHYRVPYVCEYNGSFPWVVRHWNRRRLFHERLSNEIELLNLRAADVIVVVSQPLLEELRARGIDTAKVLVNPNGVDPERYSPQVDGSAVRTRLGLEGKTVIGFIGTFGPWHGAEVLTRAFAQLVEREGEYRDRVRLLMIGEGPSLPACRDVLRAAGLLQLCSFTGQVPQEQGPAHLAACDILASPHVPNPDGSRFFGSPTKLFEYMAMGSGIVASRLEQVAEVLEHDSTAWLVAPGDPGALAEGLRVLVDDPERRGRLGRAARAEVISRYTWREHTQRIIDKLLERCG